MSSSAAASTAVARAIALVLLLSGACRRPAPPAPAAPPPARAGVLAEVEGAVITKDDLERQIGKRPVTSRPRFEEIEHKRELLEQLVRFEVLAKEAEKLGLDKDPSVLQAARQQMVAVLVQRELGEKTTAVPDSEALKYYENHDSEFNRPAEARVSQIVISDRSTAARVAGLARKLPRDDPRGFIDLVERYSEDRASRGRGGDLGMVDANSTHVPRPVVDAALALVAVHDLAPLVQTPAGFHILRLTEKIPARNRPFAAVKREIALRLSGAERTRKMEAWYERLRQAHHARTFDDQLATVAVR